MLTKDLTNFIDLCIDINDRPRHVFEYDVIQRSAGIDEDAILQYVHALCEYGYADYACLSASCGDVDFGFYLSHKGLHYKAYQRLDARERWKERIFGFVLGVLASVLASAIYELI